MPGAEGKCGRFGRQARVDRIDDVACYNVLHSISDRKFAMSTLTIRLDPALEKQLNAVAKATKRQKSDIVRDALRRQLALTQFRALRNVSLPLAEAAGYLTDEDVFRDVS